MKRLDATPRAALFARVAIVGVGLIGGSLGAAIRQQQLAKQVVGIERDLAIAQQARSLQLIDEAATDLAACAGADLIVLAVPVRQTKAVLAALLPHVQAEALITDTGSTKQNVVAAARAVLGPRLAQFIPGHPIAGREANGPMAAQPALFEGKRVMLTPLAEHRAGDLARIQALWQAVGARVSHMDAPTHDAVFAAVSHLPHLLAYALVAQIASAPDAATKLAYAGGGFRDFTRIAASSPEMWRDILLANRDTVLHELSIYEQVLAGARALLAQGDAAQIEQWLAQSAVVRQQWQQEQQGAPT
jgi:prephenate dehydrogenase